jgi:hypothetical protein
VTVSSTHEILVGVTNESGHAQFVLLAVNEEPYRVTMNRGGYSQGVFLLPVEVFSDTVPPGLYIDAPSVANLTPLTLTGLTEPGVEVTLGKEAIEVDGQGRFTTTVALVEGANQLHLVATDASSNTTAISPTIVLDTLPPTLTITYPPHNLSTTREVISVTGKTGMESTVAVNLARAVLDPENGAFGAWILLQEGQNQIEIVASDRAGNVVEETRLVTFTMPASKVHRLYLPIIIKNGALEGCDELVKNGGFEASGDWERPITAYRAQVSTAEAHSGSRSMRVGIVDVGANKYSYSSARQWVSIPADAASATLSFWLYPLSGDPAAVIHPARPLASSPEAASLKEDAQYVLVLDENEEWIDTLLWQRSDSREWTYHQVDLLDYAGRTINVGLCRADNQAAFRCIQRRPSWRDGYVCRRRVAGNLPAGTWQRTALYPLRSLTCRWRHQSASNPDPDVDRRRSRWQRCHLRRLPGP